MLQKNAKMGRSNSDGSSILVDPFEPIPRIDLTDEVVRRFKLLLEQGKIQPGSRLPPERELATILGISRPSLRHGLKALELMGTIESKRRHGTFVSKSAGKVLENPLDFVILLSDITFDKVFEVRKIIEMELAALAAERAHKSELQTIEACLAQQRTKFDSPEEWLNADISFHNAIAQAAHNILFSLFLEGIRRLVVENMRASLQLATEERLLKTYHEHSAIVKSLQSRDEAGARQAMSRHLDSVFQLWHQVHHKKALNAQHSKKREP